LYHVPFAIANSPVPTALKADDIQALKTKFGFQPDEKFVVPQETYDTYAAVASRGASLESEWSSLLSSYGKKYPNEYAELTRRISGKLPDGWEKTLPVYKPGDAAQASRKLSEIVLTAISPVLPDLLGGSADLTGSNLTKVKGSTDFQPPSTKLGTYAGTYIRFGVREHAMGAIANGLHAYGGIVPFVATFLVGRPVMFVKYNLTHSWIELRLVRCWCRQVVCPQRTPSHLGW
jgi:transketolase